MAVIKRLRGENIVGDKVTAEVGAHYWQILQGQIEPEPAEQDYCDSVHRIYLNWMNAPADYVLERAAVLRSMYQGAERVELEQRIEWASGEREKND